MLNLEKRMEDKEVVKIINGLNIEARQVADKVQYSGAFHSQSNNLGQFGPKGLRAQGSIGIDPHSTHLEYISEQSPMQKSPTFSKVHGRREEVDEEESNMEMVAETPSCRQWVA